MMKWFIIGIAGPTCSGKTSIAEKIFRHFKNSVLIKQDTYFLPQDDPRQTLIPELNHFNWEILSSLDMSKMYSDILEIIKPNETLENNESKLLIIEGFVIYNYKPIADLFDQKYFIDISKEICWDRRKVRVYNPPDVPGYFDKTVWPEHIKHKSELSKNKNFYNSIHFLDGSKSFDNLYDEVVQGISKILE